MSNGLRLSSERIYKKEREKIRKNKRHNERRKKRNQIDEYQEFLHIAILKHLLAERQI